MKKLLFLFLLIPLFSYSQNIVRIPWMEKENDTAITSRISPGFELFKLIINPCYKDRYYKITLESLDSLNKETVLSQAEISFKLIVYRKDYKMPDGKYEWDYEATIKSNETWKDDYLEIGDCSDTKHLICYFRTKVNEKYSVKLYSDETQYCEFGIENGVVWGR
jgi:hypothetical protein